MGASQAGPILLIDIWIFQALYQQMKNHFIGVGHLLVAQFWSTLHLHQELTNTCQPPDSCKVGPDLLGEQWGGPRCWPCCCGISPQAFPSPSFLLPRKLYWQMIKASCADPLKARNHNKVSIGLWCPRSSLGYMTACRPQAGKYLKFILTHYLDMALVSFHPLIWRGESGWVSV